MLQIKNVYSSYGVIEALSGVSIDATQNSEERVDSNELPA